MRFVYLQIRLLFGSTNSCHPSFEFPQTGVVEPLMYSPPGTCSPPGMFTS